MELLRDRQGRFVSKFVNKKLQQQVLRNRKYDEAEVLLDSGDCVIGKEDTDSQRRDFEIAQYAACDKEDAEDSDSLLELEVDMAFDDVEAIHPLWDKRICIASGVEIKGISLKGYGIIYAGPYVLRPQGIKGIKLAPEVAGDYDHMMCISDFGVPTVKEMDIAILTGLKYLQESGSFFVGCMMGRGRTGMYLACFLKAFGYEKPVDEVRALYNAKAVETEQQENFVAHYPVEKFEYLVRFLYRNQ